jgi:hypothetical protein
MRARRPQGPTSTFVQVTVVAIAVSGVAVSARAQEADPFAAEAPPAVPQSNVAEQSRQAPASAPAPSDANFPTGLVERLPSSAYPEPTIRGLYGGSLWLDMQGHQWPYYPRIGIGISGYGWVDTDYKRTRIGDPGQSDHWTQLFEQGRFALRVTPTYSNGNWFVQTQVELIGNLNQLDVQPNVFDTDDIWVRTGVWKSWDVTVGKYEAFPVYHLGMGLDLNTDERIGAYDQSHGAIAVPQPYLASFLYYRAPGPANIALHLFPIRGLRLELLAQWGNEGATNDIGGRPAIIYDLGWLKFRAAAEYQWKFARDPAPSAHNEYRNRGVAGSVQLVFAPWIELGPNIGRAVTDLYDSSTLQPDGSFLPRTDKSGDIWSYGGFLNVHPFGDLLIGTGLNYASFTNLHKNASGQGDKSTNTQTFLAVQYLVYHQLFVKVVGGYAKTHFDFSFSNMAPYDDDMFSVRVRLMYLY